MNEDTAMLYEGLANDETLYRECERSANYAGIVSDNEDDFHAELADEIKRIADDNREFIPGFSKSEPIEYDLVDYDEIARLYKYADYCIPEDDE